MHQSTGYPHFHESSGIYSKFIPYTPARKVKGINIVAMIVSTFITSFILLLMLDRYISSMPESISLYVSIVSITCMVWSYMSLIYICVGLVIRSDSLLKRLFDTSRRGHTDLRKNIISFLRTCNSSRVSGVGRSSSSSSSVSIRSPSFSRTTK